MLTSKVAKRYAQGLLDFTNESGQTATVFSEMKDVVKVMTESKDLNKFFLTPYIDSKKKIEVANEIFKGLSVSSQNLIRLVIKHGRENQLKNIAQEFINKVEDLSGVQRVTLTTATPLSKENLDQILRSTNLVNADSNFDLKVNVKPEILGGYVLRVGDQQVDASVKTKLNQVKKDFQLN
ncbi:F-type H+-transporting ATPase subunit delta [Chryseobacterium bernardetii]|jgi:F-type H+-transporting ATPase subunit delta|uniref:ATP synthase subunit delta n=3 Tax=Chryseobacterium TaxID=59732 RepID=A0A543EK30_9FLAO|nr:MULTISPECIES: ATP synthase F1 subunit delta [Chryseobacterium]MDR6370288.1 F-type H+-transporting ATPase subunit delta [Chryseobacterium vietnamense]MDR6440469.1 F-type H+-transporting ATPase subunit delta [Chryseobacterium bernardetii]MDR6458353.1 F-type H+-transporting ATPase subunit delta [Chryseobacterium vietnamense]MDR6486965.1 F-type H+-transporting ATPase subunit delta [Chryseobacterium vietnamense]TQM21902.1 F-type H+-transporting ATPase subunit delta [Chryseobacterium aquifrigiden